MSPSPEAHKKKIPERFRRGPDKRTAEERGRHAKGDNPQRAKGKVLCKAELCTRWGRRGWAKGFCKSCASKQGYEDAQSVRKVSHHKKKVKKTNKCKKSAQQAVKKAWEGMSKRRREAMASPNRLRKQCACAKLPAEVSKLKESKRYKEDEKDEKVEKDEKGEKDEKDEATATKLYKNDVTPSPRRAISTQSPRRHVHGTPKILPAQVRVMPDRFMHPRRQQTMERPVVKARCEKNKGMQSNVPAVPQSWR